MVQGRSQTERRLIVSVKESHDEAILMAVTSCQAQRGLLEQSVASLIREFERDTGLSVTSVDTRRTNEVGNRHGKLWGVYVEVML